MNREIIRRHNERVKEDDVVFHIGDFCFKSRSGKGAGIGVSGKQWEEKLNGKIIFVRGSHDKNNSCKTNIKRIIMELGGHTLNLVHDPVDAVVSCEINLVGHVHRLWKFKRIRKGFSFTDAINVGCDVWNFYPVTMDEILREYERWKKDEGLS